MMTDPFDDLFDRWDETPVDGTHAQATYAALAPGFRQARTRRQLRLGAAAAVVLFAVSAPIALRQGGGSDAVIQTATDGTDDAEIADPLDDAEPVDSTDDVGLPPSDDLDDDPSTTVEPDEAPDPDDVDDDETAVLDQGPDSSTDDDDDDGSTDESDEPSTTTPDPTDSDDAPPATEPDPVTIRSAGGTVVASIAAGAIVIEDVTPTPGFVAQVEVSGDEAEVEFSPEADGVDDVKIRLDIVDGALVWSIETEPDESSTDEPEIEEPDVSDEDDES